MQRSPREMNASYFTSSARPLGLFLLVSAGLFFPLASSCTPGVGSGLSKAPTAEKCDPTALNEVISPLVVEWPSNARSDLEAAMHDNVVVVSFTCDKVKVLPDCKVKGTYGYRAVTPRLETMLIEGRDNIQASFGGVAWAVSGKLEREANLDLSHVLVGKMSTTRAAVTRADLEGGDDYCKGATHFVKRADIGAFAYATGTSVKAGMSAKAFTQGASVETESKEVRTKKDGDQDACKASKLADSKAPEGCGAGIRVALTPIKNAPGKDESVSKKGLPDGLGCPTGFSYVDGACTSSPGNKATLCSEGDEPGCQKQCAAGSRASCDRYARVLLYRDDEGKELTAVLGKISAAKARFEEACLADQPATCTALGLSAFAPLLASGDTSDKAGLKRGFDYFASGCRAGDFVACSFLRAMAGEPALSEIGIKGDRLLKDTISRGCTGGSAVPCGFESFEHAMGQGSFKQDGARALELAEKACLGSFAEGCLVHAGLLGSKTSCEKAWKAADDRLQHIYPADQLCAIADQVADNAAAAKTSLARACSLGAKAACK